MSYTIECYHKKSPKKIHSEDALFINEKTGKLGVLDGATPVSDFKNEEGFNGAYLASHLFKDYFENESTSLSLKESVIEANRLLREEMDKYAIPFEVFHERWFTCIASVYIKEYSLEICQLGDSMVIVQYKNGNVACLSKDTLSDLGNKCIAQRNMRRLNGEDLPDEAYYENNRLPRIRYQKAFANVDGGYTVANGDERVEEFIFHQEIPLSKISKVLLVTDGLFTENTSWANSLPTIVQQGFVSYSDKVDAEREQMNLYKDDKTGILITFS